MLMILKLILFFYDFAVQDSEDSQEVFHAKQLFEPILKYP